MEKYGSEVRLLPNQIYTITLKVKQQEITSTFSSKYTPLYSNVRTVRGDYRELFSAYSDDHINNLIYQNSLLALDIASTTIDTSSDIPNYVKQYVRYKTEYDLLTDITMTRTINISDDIKTLGEMTIQKTRRAPNMDAVLRVAKERMLAWEGRLAGMTARPTGATRAGGTSFPLTARVF